MDPNIHSSTVGRALTLSVTLHVIVGIVCALALDHDDKPVLALVDIEVAPAPPPVEALPQEVVRPWEQDRASAATEEAAPPVREGDFAIDAGLPDAPIDAPVKKKKRPDAAEPDAAMVAEEGTGSGSGPGGEGTDAGLGDEPDAGGEGSASTAAAPAVEGAPTTAGTAANLLTYFPKAHVVTALIRFDRLRGTEWAAPTERLLRPMPDYQILFGPNDAQIATKLETLVISSPAPKDATATTLVARTKLARPALRDFLGATTPVTWSASKGGLLGTRALPHDKRVFLSPFKDWFLLAQPGDIGSTATSAGDLDTVVATGKLPPWLTTIRTIEAESGDPRGPALVLTLGLGGQNIELGDNDFGLGISSVTTPDRVSLAMELVKDGWLVRGNMLFKTDAAAADFITAADTAKERVADSRALQLAMGKPVARVIANLSFARTGPRVSYTTSVSIADARLILAVAAAQLDAYFAP